VILRAAALALAVALVPARAGAWGDKGHQMTARVAARALPRDVPAFFRNAVVELGYLCPEPDRWRSEQREPALRGLANRDHVFKLEDMTQPLPAHRYDFLLQYVGKPKPGGGTYQYQDLGFSPYAMAEHSEMLTVSFMLWRNAASKTATDRRIKRQIEQNVIHSAGMLAHFVTDIAMPLHTTISGNGWSSRLPNPKGYVGREIHKRFEVDYVNAAIEEKDFESLVGPPRPLGPWLEAGLAHIRASHQHVEAVYALDQAQPFGGGNETAEAKRFTCARLADASTVLRDFWYTAWLRSGPLAEEAKVAAARRAEEDAKAQAGSASRRTSR
jgi:hypothetical protein